MKNNKLVFLLVILNLCVLQLLAQVKIAWIQNKSSIAYAIDTNLLKNLALEDLWVENSNSNLLITPSTIYSIIPTLIDTGDIKKILKPKYPREEKFILNTSSIQTKNQFGTDSIVRMRFVVSAEKEPSELSGLQPIEINGIVNVRSVDIQKIGRAWWLVVRGWYQNKNIAVFYRLRKSGNTLSLPHKAKTGQKNRIICSQKYDFLKCKPVIGTELTCHCEGYPPPKGTCSTDIMGHYMEGLNLSYGLGRLLRQ